MAEYERSGIAYDALHEVRGLDYAAGAATITDIVRARCAGARTLLDVACGTGRHLEHLRQTFEVEGLDLAEGMATVAEARLPGVTIHRGDMRSFRLGRRFDAVTCMFSSIGYLLTVADLRRGIRRMASHLEPGGVLVVEPWIHPDTWHGSNVHAESGRVGELAVARVGRTWRTGRRTTLEMVWTLATLDGLQTVAERHELTLHPVSAYLDAFRRAGLEVEHDPVGPLGRGLFVGTAPTSS